MKGFRILLLEDSKTDAEFITYLLGKEGMEFESLRVETEEDFKKSLLDFGPDIILSDYILPAYDGLSALVHVQKNHPDIPVIMVSGAIGEEKAVELLRTGAKDYIIKDRLSRLPSAIRRVLKEQEEIRKRREVEKKLLESDERIRNILNTALDAVISMDKKGLVTSWNNEAERLFGYSAKEVLGKNLSELIIPERLRTKHTKGLEKFIKTGDARIIGHRVETTAMKRNKAEFPIELSISLARQGNETFFSAFLRDITQKKISEEALRESENRHRLLVENSPMCIHEIDLNGKIISMNKAGLDMMGLNDENAIKGYPYLNAVNKEDKSKIEKLMQEAYQGLTSQFEFKSSGKKYQIYKSCFVPLINKNGRVEKLMGITEDITKQKMDEAALLESENYFRQLADYDSLTKLPNRRLLNDRLERAMMNSKRNGKYGTLMFLDLDNFKPLNDQYGHNIGDILLIEVANRIRKCVREIDTVSRFGGDEFVIMVSELDSDKVSSANIAKFIAEKIRVSLAEPYVLVIHPEGKDEIKIEHRCSASIGLVLFVNHEQSSEEILNWADTAMYKAKSAGRNQISFIDIDVLIENNENIEIPPEDNLSNSEV